MEAPSKSLQRSAVIAGVLSFVLSLPYTILKDVPNPSPQFFSLLIDYPSVLMLWVIQTVGFCFLLPVIHLAIANLWKSKRNEQTSLRILRGWSIVIIAVVGIQLPSLIAAI